MATACLPFGTAKVTGVVATAAGPTGTVRTSVPGVAAAIGADCGVATALFPDRSPKNARAAPMANTATPTKRMLLDLLLFMSSPDTGTVRRPPHVSATAQKIGSSREASIVPRDYLDDADRVTIGMFEGREVAVLFRRVRRGRYGFVPMESRTSREASTFPPKPDANADRARSAKADQPRSPSMPRTNRPSARVDCFST